MKRDKLMDDWRRVCNALNTSPDSDVEVVLTKVRVLQSIAHENSHTIADAVQAEREACALLVESGMVQVSGRQYANYLEAWRDLRDALAAAIRARSEVKS